MRKRTYQAKIHLFLMHGHIIWMGMATDIIDRERMTNSNSILFLSKF
jgi:hypothetical protein